MPRGKCATAPLLRRRQSARRCRTGRLGFAMESVLRVYWFNFWRRQWNTLILLRIDGLNGSSVYLCRLIGGDSITRNYIAGYRILGETISVIELKVLLRVNI
jgi:hypothetical protein